MSTIYVCQHNSNNFLFDNLLTQLLAILPTMDVFKQLMFSSQATSHKADWIHTTRCLLCIAFLYAQVISLTNVFEVEESHSCLLENYIATTLLFVYILLFMRSHTCLCPFLSCLLLLVYWKQVRNTCVVLLLSIVLNVKQWLTVFIFVTIW